ncbi:MAG TPA: dihydroorotate dehydrogenase-like protein [Acidimicrobiia bacterium]|nr:dihydroorotate dehydrogenase-like protein [Acidimicrobiia bacterium]
MTVDLRTSYLGLDLDHPVIPSASPLTGDVDHILALVEAGAPAVVLPSLFEEQIDHDAMAVHYSLEMGSDGFGEAAEGFFPQLDDYNTGPEDYIDLIKRAKAEVPVPVIASLNGVSTGGWTMYSEILADQGIDALELNVYRLAADMRQTSEVVEKSYVDLVEKVKKSVGLPLAVKVGPYFSSIPDMARRLCDAGADALVMFNRFYQPDIDLETLDVIPNLVLSDPVELRLVLRWLAIMHGRIDCDMAATSGVHEATDAVKALLAGATVTMMASALLRHGPSRLTEVRDGIRSWLGDHGYESVSQARGSLSYATAPNPEVFERAGYMKTLKSYVPTW